MQNMKHRLVFVIFFQYLADVHGSPRPMIVSSWATKLIFCAEDKRVTVKDDCMLEKALFLCLTVYYIKDVTYPSAFAQTLGLIQSLLHVFHVAGQAVNC